MVKIYTITTKMGPRTKLGAYGYLMEAETGKGPVTVHKFTAVRGMKKLEAEMKAIIEALQRMKKPSQLQIYTDSGMIVSGFNRGWMEKWEKNGFQTAKGELVANAGEWMELEELLEPHQFEIIYSQKHPYHEWMMAEAEREVVKMSKNVDFTKCEATFG